MFSEVENVFLTQVSKYLRKYLNILVENYLNRVFECFSPREKVEIQLLACIIRRNNGLRKSGSSIC